MQYAGDGKIMDNGNILYCFLKFFFKFFAIGTECIQMIAGKHEEIYKNVENKE